MSGWLDALRDHIAPEILAQAQALGAQGGDEGDFLLKGKHLSPGTLLAALSRYHDLPAILLSGYEPEGAALARLSEDIARRFTVMPLFVHKDRIFVATADPGDIAVEDAIGQKTGLMMGSVVAFRGDIERAINRFYLVKEYSAEKVKTLATRKADEDQKPQPEERPSVKMEDDEAPSVRLVNHILSTAVRLGASDIHLEPFEDEVSLRFRLDGVLREHPAPPLDLLRAVTSRIKILSDMDVAERRLPQDGRISTTVDGKEYDLRVSLIPNLYGESIVIRVLVSRGEVKSLKDLGFAPGMLDSYARMISRPHGVVLVTGPTGSGKSTTLYASLRHIYSPEKKILTLEDPVEAKMKGITQFQMNAPIGFTFARALRSVLRHDPEVVLVGEIRDQETAEIAIRASLTGHLLLSTLHTNDAASAPTRLIDMGVQGYLVMTSLLGVLAQRLIRRLCPRCREPFSPDEGHLRALGIESLPPGAAVYRPVGCGECQNLGYKGRVAIYELLEVTPEMRRLPESELTSETLRALAEQKGFVSLRESAVAKWLEGVTSYEEAMKMTVE